MARFFIHLSYDGGAFCGWQSQPNGDSVQTTVERALGTILRTPTAIVGAGRTDAGVHARRTTAHFEAEIGDEAELFRRLNAILPKSVAVLDLERVSAAAHARFSATARRYEYFVHQGKNPFLEEFSLRVPEDLDFEKMNLAAQKLTYYQDFTSFSKLHTDVKTNFCKIFQARWEKRGEQWAFCIEANRFLRGMVRAIVGTLFVVGKGKMSVEEFCKVIEEKNRQKAGSAAPAKALFLTDVIYPKEIFNS